MRRLALLAVLALTACGVSWRSLVAVTLRSGGAAAAIAYQFDAREAGAVDCIAARVAADILPTAADAVFAESVVFHVDVSECIETHGLGAVGELEDETKRAVIGAAIESALGSARDLAGDAGPCARAWVQSLSLAMDSLAPALLDALGDGTGVASASWSRVPSGVCR